MKNSRTKLKKRGKIPILIQAQSSLVVIVNATMRFKLITTKVEKFCNVQFFAASTSQRVFRTFRDWSFDKVQRSFLSVLSFHNLAVICYQ